MGMPPADRSLEGERDLCVSASRASSSPCLASKALLAVTTELPAPQRRLDAFPRGAFRPADQFDKQVDLVGRARRRDRRKI